jgi:hypothetical protein
MISPLIGLGISSTVILSSKGLVCVARCEIVDASSGNNGVFSELQKIALKNIQGIIF